MGGLVLIAIVGIVVWGVLHFNKQHNKHHSDIDASQNQALFEAEQERDELRERVKVLERIVTESNTPSAIESRRLSEDIDALRDGSQSDKTT